MKWGPIVMLLILRMLLIFSFVLLDFEYFCIIKLVSICAVGSHLKCLRVKYIWLQITYTHKHILLFYFFLVQGVSMETHLKKTNPSSVNSKLLRWFDVEDHWKESGVCWSNYCTWFGEGKKISLGSPPLQDIKSLFTLCNKYYEPSNGLCCSL